MPRVRFEGQTGGGGGGGGDFGARVYFTADQVIANAVGTTITWAAERWDNGNFWVVGSPTVFTVPAGLGGRYLVGAHLRYDGALGGSVRLIGLYHQIAGGGAVTIFGVGQRNPPVVLGSAIDMTVTSEKDAAAGDTFYVVTYQDCGLALGLQGNTTLGGTTWLCDFWCQKIDKAG